MDDTNNQAKKQRSDYIKPYMWKKGQSGNPAGRPKGKTLKEFAKEYLMSLPDDEKVEYLESLPTEIVWKMAEGNPTSDNKVELTPETIKAINYLIPNGINPEANL